MWARVERMEQDNISGYSSALKFWFCDYYFFKKETSFGQWVRFPSSGINRNLVQLCFHKSESLGAELNLRKKQRYIHIGFLYSFRWITSWKNKTGQTVLFFLTLRLKSGLTLYYYGVSITLRTIPVVRLMVGNSFGLGIWQVFPRV